MTEKTKEFLQKLKDSGNWNEEYDYSKVEYINSNTKVNVIDDLGCNHEILPYNLLLGNKLTIKSVLDKNNYFILKAKEVHGDEYDYSLVDYKNSYTKLKIICPKHGEFEQIPNGHLSGKNCIKCSGVNKSTNSDFILKAKEVHADKYDYSLVDYKNAKTKVVIICPEHGQFKQTPNSHLVGNSCNKCGGKIKPTNSDFILKAKQIHNNKYSYEFVEYKNNHTKIKIICPEHGVFEQTPANHLRSGGCAECAGNSSSTTNNFILKAKEIHGDKYDYLLVEYKGAHLKVKIICPEHGEFEQTPASHLSGSGCPVCGNGFIKSYKIHLLGALENSDLLTMDPIELSIIIQQGKLPSNFRPLINTEAESEERILSLRELRERFETEEDESNEDITNITTNNIVDSELISNDDVDSEITTLNATNEPRLPSVNSVRDLHSLDNAIYAGMDEDAIQSLILYKLRKIWNSLLNGDVSVESIKTETGGKYFTLIKDEFISEYESVLLIQPNEGYQFKDRNGNISQPNLMQKLTVYRLLKNKYYGNWSGTGAGKTLSFILASRKLDARLTIVIALNSTITQTCKSIKQVYPNSKCYTEYNEDFIFDKSQYNYLVLNYEKFQQINSEKLFQSLTNNNQIDFVVIDEVHNAKQREEDNESIRRGVMTRLLGRARENENLHVLAMSATPVINNLYEAKSLLQLMSGLEYEDIQTRRTIGNALAIFQQLTLNGLRFIPKYDMTMSELTGRNMTNLNIDGSHLLDNLLELPPNDYIGVEKLILQDKLNSITSYLRKGVIIYSYFTTDVVNKIQNHCESLGFKVGTYTGDESNTLRNNNLNDFINRKLDILIGSRPIGTGVDGLQDVCNRMICVTLPWTDSEYTQLKGRIYRQGSEFNTVEIIIPQVRINLGDDEIWSWDIQRLNLIKNKKTLADAAVDGVIPSNTIPSPETMLRRSIESLKNWQDRVSDGAIISPDRKKMQIELYPNVDDVEREQRIISELSEFNRRGKICHSTTMHKEFSDNPDSWYRYHALRKSRMESWEEIPYEYIATKITDRRDVVADFGCGENLFRNCIPNNKVYSFDHVAIDETVKACDMRYTGLDNESIDVAVFSLALWGTNSKEYIKEAYRVLRRKGMIYISEPSKDYETSEKQQELIDLIKEEGFQQVGGVENRGKFVYLIGIKI